MQNTKIFQRYLPLIDDWLAFQEISLQPLPTCIWTNTLRLTPGKLAAILTADGLDFEPLGWYAGGFKLSPDFKPGRHWAYLAGLYQVQEEVSMLPLLFLNPQPHELVLDLCAAPGNKSAQIAVMMDNRGTLVANDINYARMRAVRQVLERLGLVNVATVTHDGANYPPETRQFDKILVDVPCSCEGTSRKKPAVLQRIKKDSPLKKSGLQQALLRKAVQRCKVGGRIVYSTCTYAPEENEAVVDAILAEYGPHTLRIVPARLEGLTTSAGLVTWNGQQFHSSLQNTLRIWPHQNDTGGFFVAVIEKTSATSSQSSIPSAETSKQNSPASQTSFGNPPALEKSLDILAARFGILPSTFTPYHMFEQKRGRVYVVAQDHHPPQKPIPDAVGMLFMKTRLKYPKLSTAAAQMFGPQASRNYIETNRKQIEAYLKRQDFSVSAKQAQHCTSRGYVLLKHQGYVLGVAVYHPHESGEGATIVSMFPKGWSPNKG